VTDLHPNIDCRAAGKCAIATIALVVACHAGPASSAAAPAPTGLAAPATASTDSLHHADVALARAVVLWRDGDLRGAADLLAGLDLSPGAAWERADRAAFLLAVLERRLGRPQALRDKAATAADAASASPYRRWLAHLALWDAASEGLATTAGPLTSSSRPLPGDAVLEASLLLESGQSEAAADLLSGVEPEGDLAAMHLQLLALALQQAGRDPLPALRRLADLDIEGGPGSALVAAARLQMARAALTRGENPDQHLQRVVAAGNATPDPLAGQAHRLLALTALDRGDTTAALHHLDEALARRLEGLTRRQALLERGALHGAQGDWQAAAADHAAAEADWRREQAELATLVDGARDGGVGAAWSAWTAVESWDVELRPDTRALALALDALAEAALDLRGQPEADPSRLLKVQAGRESDVAAAWSGAAADHQPTTAEFDAWRRLRDGLARAEAQRAERAWDVDRQLQERDRRLGFLTRGQLRAAVEADTLSALTGRLDALQSRLAAGLVTLRALHDQALADIAGRTQAANEELRRNALYAEAIRHFHVNGPQDTRRATAAADATAAGELLAQEMVLSGQMESFNDAFATRAPGLLGRSLREIWEPRLVEGNRALRTTLGAHATRTASLATELASLAAQAQADAELARREQDHAAAVAHAAVMADSLHSTRVAIAAAVAGRGRQRLALEREGIDYHLADAAYWRAVEVATDPATAEQADLVAPARELASARLDTFLARHPHSTTLSEARFRRADLDLFRAREAFQARMAGYLDQTGAGADAARAMAPLFDGERAAALYEAILRDDPAFAHSDAVLFNLGMLKADSGQPGAMELLARLVREYPAAAGAQEAWLRLGDDRFDAGDHAGSVPHYENAAGGNDPSLAAIALYKLGWARFADDGFAESGVAFSRLLDLLGDGAGAATRDGQAAPRAGGPANLREEARDHMVQALLRAGGARAFADHVERVGARPWDERTLAAMADQAARYSLDDDAVACDELWLRRYPESPGALAAAERLVGALERGGKGEAARKARLEQAPRFLPGSPWLAATDSLALRERADRFARRAYEGAAVFEHQAARAGRDTTAWSRALDHYETFLAHWPDAAEAPRLDYQAGEAARALHAHEKALAHFEAAARSDTATFAADAAWQAVAVRDAWYRSTLTPGRGTGDDPLATALLKAGDDYLARHPGSTHAAELAWRQGQVAYAHGWDEDAAGRLLAFSRNFPDDDHAPEAARLAGDAQYRRRDFTAAGAAYEQALALAGKTGRSKLAAELAAVLPLCAYENAAAVDSTESPAAAAPLYLAVATRWPAYEHASLALYRAGLGFAAAGEHDQAVAAWERIVAADANGAYGRDAAVRIAQSLEAAGHAASASLAWARFSELYPDGEDAPAALLKAIDLREVAADTAGAESLRDDYLKRFPNDTETAFAVAGSRARRELDQAAREGTPVATLVTRPVAKKKAAAAPASAVRRYLDLAEAHPEQADASLLARVDYLAAEESLRDYLALPLTQPLPASIERKNKRLEAVVALFNRCVDRGDPEYAHAAAYRIGEAVVHLGTALLASERPAGLAGDDLAAYDEVLREQSWTFTERGENAWAQLLRKADRSSGRDPGGWLARTETELWPRLARRYVHRPELEYPLAAASARP
jgi:TolA-binding protein